MRLSILSLTMITINQKPMFPRQILSSKRRIYKRTHRADAPFRYQGFAGTARYHYRRHGLLYLRSWCPRFYLNMVLHLVRGDRADHRAVLRRLAELQYSRNDTELRRASYRVHGDIIDIYPAESEREAVRVELFDDEIETISLFDPLTGGVIRKVPRYTVYPKSHYVTPVKHC